MAASSTQDEVRPDVHDPAPRAKLERARGRASWTSTGSPPRDQVARSEGLTWHDIATSVTEDLRAVM